MKDFISSKEDLPNGAFLEKINILNVNGSKYAWISPKTKGGPSGWGKVSNS